MGKATTSKTSVEPSKSKDLERKAAPAGGIMKEEEEEAIMLQNQNPATPTYNTITSSHKKHLIIKSASTPHKRNTPIIVAVDGCDKERFEAETTDENTAEEGKAEEDLLSMSSSLLKEETGRERLKRHRVEVAAAQIWIPDTWGQEHLLKDWIDSSSFDSALVPKQIMSARTALADQGRTPLSVSGRLGLENSC